MSKPNLLLSGDELLRQDLHTHSNFSDGKNTPEEMVLSAIEKGLRAYGISDHSFCPFDQSYGMLSNEKIPVYLDLMHRLKEKYADKIDLYCGIEYDVLSPDVPKEKFDYVVGSVHYVFADGEYVPVDGSDEQLAILGTDVLTEAAKKHFAGDIYALAEAYYENVARVVEVTDCDIIGHFDLLTKMNEDGAVFDPGHPRYVAAWKKAADALLRTGRPFEINTGAISRGYRKTPYPSRVIADYLTDHGARLVFSSDSHSVRNIAFAFGTLKDFYGLKQ